MSPPAVPSRRILTELSTNDILALTRVLILHERETQDEQWFADQARQIETLPKSLLASKGGLARAISKVSSAMKQPTEKATLCPTHKPLEPHIIRRIFIQVTKEVTVKNAGVASCTNLPIDVSSWLRRLQSINALWMSPELYRVAFDAKPSDERPEEITSGCEACILSVIGGAHVMLLDLHNSAESRKKKAPIPPPVLMRFTEGWLTAQDLNIPDKAYEIMMEIRAVRRAQLKVRRKRQEERKHGKAPSIHSAADTGLGKFEFAFEDGEAKHLDQNDDDDGDAEMISVYYSDKLAEANNYQTAVSRPAQEMHPAFRASLNFGHNGTVCPESQTRGRPYHSTNIPPSRTSSNRTRLSGREEVPNDGPSMYTRYGEYRRPSFEQSTAHFIEQEDPFRDDAPNPPRPNSRPPQNDTPSFGSSTTARTYDNGADLVSPRACISPKLPGDRSSTDRDRAYRLLNGSPEPDEDITFRERKQTKDVRNRFTSGYSKSEMQPRASSVDSSTSGDSRVTRWSNFGS
jgi:hypothetical protein